MRLTLLLILLSTLIVTTEGRAILDPIGGAQGITVDSGGATTDGGSFIDPAG